MQTYPGVETDDNVNMVDAIILYIFTAETLLKILSEGWAFWRFWVGSEWKWNK